MKKKHFIGIDIAKKTFDAVIYEQGSVKASAGSYRHFSNNGEGFALFLSWLTSENGFKSGAVVVGMENTGMYDFALRRFLENRGVDYCAFNPLSMKRSLGLVRGKDDKVDAFRIARFTYQNRDCLRFSRLSGVTVRKLKALASERARLVRQQAANKAFVTDHKSFEEMRAQVARAQELVSIMQTFIDRVGKEMEETIREDTEVMTSYSLLTSIKASAPSMPWPLSSPRTTSRLSTILDSTPATSEWHHSQTLPEHPSGAEQRSQSWPWPTSRP